MAAIVMLLGLCGWLFAKLTGANRDIEVLQKRVEHLKKQLLLMR